MWMGYWKLSLRMLKRNCQWMTHFLQRRFGNIPKRCQEFEETNCWYSQHTFYLVKLLQYSPYPYYFFPISTSFKNGSLLLKNTSKNLIPLQSTQLPVNLSRSQKSIKITIIISKSSLIFLFGNTPQTAKVTFIFFS